MLIAGFGVDHVDTRPLALAILGWSYGGDAALQSQVLDPDLFKAVVAIAPVTDFGSWREERRFFSDFDQVWRMVGTSANIAAGSPARHADAFHAPVLMFHADRDANVNIAESRLMASRLRSAGKPVEFTGLDHQLEDNQARTQMLSRIDVFLRTSLHLAP